jgi:hypothetical protein
MEQEMNQTEFELYKTLVNETLAKLSRIEYSVSNREYIAELPCETMIDSLDLRDIAETLGL